MSGVDIHKAAAALWISGGLDTLFKGYWEETDRDYYLSLNDGDAAPDTPFPYAVYEAPKPDIKTRMSGDGRSKNIIKGQPWTFHIYAQQTTTQSAKERVAELVSEVMKVFGGHPTSTPLDLTLDSGTVINLQYANDYGMMASDTVYEWFVEYTIVTDVPIMV